LLALRWNDIDFTSKVILVRNSETFTTKTRKNRIVPMSEELFRLLKDRKEAIRFECEVVFHNKNGGKLIDTSVSQKFKKYIRLSKLNDKLHFHSLRHSFASALVTSGVSLYAVQKLLGHSTSKTTEIYSHLLPQQLHREVNRGMHIFGEPLHNDLQNEVKNDTE
jgi:integrase/recombinase XerD